MANKSKGHGLQGFNRKINAGHAFGVNIRHRSRTGLTEKQKREMTFNFESPLSHPVAPSRIELLSKV